MPAGCRRSCPSPAAGRTLPSRRLSVRQAGPPGRMTTGLRVRHHVSNRTGRVRAARPKGASAEAPEVLREQAEPAQAALLKPNPPGRRRKDSSARPTNLLRPHAGLPERSRLGRPGSHPRCASSRSSAKSASPGPAVPGLLPRGQAQPSPSAARAACRGPSQPAAANPAQAAPGPTTNPGPPQAGLRPRGGSPVTSPDPEPRLALTDRLREAPLRVPGPAPALVHPVRARRAPARPVRPGLSRRVRDRRVDPIIVPPKPSHIPALPPAPNEKPAPAGNPSPGPPRTGLRPRGGSPATAARENPFPAPAPSPGRAASLSQATRADQPVLEPNARVPVPAADPAEKRANEKSSSFLGY